MMKLDHLVLLTLCVLSTSSCHASSVTADGRPRGIKKVDIPLYTSSTFACRSDPSIVIPASHINDDYCDCTDGSDEPGTSACEHGSFWCRNVGWRGELLRSSRINDGICDCCDGSDEWEGRVTCPNTCIELGKAAGEDQLAKIQKMEAGASQRSDMISEAQRILAERQAKLTKYETRLGEKSTLLENIKTQKEAAEAVEAEERRIQEEAAAAKAAEEDRIAQEKAAADAAAAAANPPPEGGDQIPPVGETTTTTETQPSQEYPVDIDIPAVPGIAGVGIAGVGMAGVGMAGVRPPTPPPAEPTPSPAAEPAAESFPYPAEYAYNPNADKKDTPADKKDTPAEDPVLKEAQEDDNYDDESSHPPPPPETRTEAQKGDDSTSTSPEEPSWLAHIWDWVWPTSSTNPTINNTMTRLSAAISTADALRAQYSEMEASHRKTQDKLEKVKKLLANDYGESGEFTTLEGQCYKIDIRQYAYEVCPYDESRQIEGHSRTSLGRYSGWKQRVIDPLSTPDKGYVYPRVMEFTGGQTCWNGPARSAQIEFECGDSTAILSVDEPSRCVYVMRMSTQAVCQPDDIQTMRSKLEQDMKITAEMED